MHRHKAPSVQTKSSASAMQTSTLVERIHVAALIASCASAIALLFAFNIVLSGAFPTSDQPSPPEEPEPALECAPWATVVHASCAGAPRSTPSGIGTSTTTMRIHPVVIATLAFVIVNGVTSAAIWVGGGRCPSVAGSVAGSWARVAMHGAFALAFGGLVLFGVPGRDDSAFFVDRTIDGVETPLGHVRQDAPSEFNLVLHRTGEACRIDSVRLRDGCLPALAPQILWALPIVELFVMLAFVVVASARLLCAPRKPVLPEADMVTV